MSPVPAEEIFNPAPTALITGAGGHLGAPIVRALADRSFRLAVNDIDDERAGMLVGTVPGAAAFPADVSDPASVRELVGGVLEHLGSIDVLVNAVGIEGPIDAVEWLDPDSIRRVFDVNVMSLFWLCGAVVPGMKVNGRGRIINLASGAGLAGGEFASAYHASKHAVVGFTRSLARELAPDRVAVNAVCPGYVDSPMVARIGASIAAVTGSASDPSTNIPAGRMAEAGEIASTVTFLAADAPLYLTGASIVIDGGLRA